jgi:signal peptidase II
LKPESSSANEKPTLRGVLLKKITLWFLFAAATVVFFDQFTKELAIANLSPNVLTPAAPPLVNWYLIYNDSAAFSIGFGQTWIFTIISSLAALALLWFGPKAKTVLWALLAGGLLGGVVGNLIDRLTRAPGVGVGQVVDFISIPFHFPIFNVADSFICVVAVTIVILTMRGQKIGGGQ